MSNKGIILVHSSEDDDLTDSVMEHLGVLDTITKLETKTVESLERLGTVALKNKLKDRDALVLVLSAQVLSSKFIRHPMVQDLASSDSVFLIAARPCAWRVVPWLHGSSIWPKVGTLALEDTAKLDHDMTEVAYTLAAQVSSEFDVTSIEEETEEVMVENQMVDDQDVAELEEIPAAGEADVVAPEVAASEIAAGPAEEEVPEVQCDDTIQESTDSEAEDVEEDVRVQFDGTCSSVLPSGAKLDDDVLGALLELGLILGTTKEEAGDLDGAKRVYLHAARKLIDLINVGLVDGQPISRFVRSVRLAMWRSLKEAESETIDVDVLRNAFEEALGSVSVS